MILSTASQLQEEGRPGGASEGLSLDEIQAIAREVGIDADRIAQAASMLGSRSRARMGGRFGGPQKYQVEATIPAELTESDLARLVETVRRTANQQGKVQHVLNSLEWSSVGDLSQIHVTLSPRDGETSILVSVDRSGASALTAVFPFMAWFIAAGALGGATEPGTLIGVGALLGTATVGALATMATIWKATGTAVARKVTNLVATLSRDGHELGSQAQPTRALPEQAGLTPDQNS